MTGEAVEKLPTLIPGLDHVSHGGLPRGRSTLVSGTAGSAKTVFSAHFLAAGVQAGDGGGVFVTFEESPDDLRRNLRSFGWDIDAWEDDGLWAFVDASPEPGERTSEAGEYDLSALRARIGSAVSRVGAKRVSLDSVGAIFQQFTDFSVVRRELFAVSENLKDLGVTSVITAERTEEYGPIGRYGVEEFVADNVIVLRNPLARDRRRRTLEILKFRGTTHYKGEVPFTVIPGVGIEAIPLSALSLTHASSDARTPSGGDRLDEMCGGGFFRDSIVLVSGATGTGKTLVATQFADAGVGENERCLFFGFEESRDQLLRNAAGWGVDFASRERQGLLRVDCQYPESAGLEDHFVSIRSAIEDFGPARVAVDSLSALERISTDRAFREFIIALTSLLKAKGVTGLFTATSSDLMGGSSVTESHISTITDAIILLRYVEEKSEVRRAIAVLKMRGSDHDRRIRRFTIDGEGMRVGEPFSRTSGLLSGRPRVRHGAEFDFMDEQGLDES